jgi:hypothetical protein
VLPIGFQPVSALMGFFPYCGARHLNSALPRVFNGRILNFFLPVRELGGKREGITTVVIATVACGRCEIFRAASGCPSGTWSHFSGAWGDLRSFV